MVETFEIRLITFDDIKDIFVLSNDDFVRQNSFDSEKITWENHQKWFKNKLEDKNCVFYVVKENNNLVAQVRFDKVNKNEANISISLSKDYRSKGYGAKLIKLMSDKMLNDNNIKYINAYVKNENIASIKSFEKADYILKEKYTEKVRLEYNAK